MALALVAGCAAHGAPETLDVEDAVPEPEVHHRIYPDAEPEPASAPTDEHDTSEPPTRSASASAREHFQAGTTAYGLGDYETALGEFEAAHALVPDARLRYNIARTLERLGRLEQAAAELESIVDDPSMQPMRAEIRTHAAELRERAGR